MAGLAEGELTVLPNSLSWIQGPLRGGEERGKWKKGREKDRKERSSSTSMPNITSRILASEWPYSNRGSKWVYSCGNSYEPLHECSRRRASFQRSYDLTMRCMCSTYVVGRDVCSSRPPVLPLLQIFEVHCGGKGRPTAAVSSLTSDGSESYSRHQRNKSTELTWNMSISMPRQSLRV